jgi:hypothetical protein
VRPTILAVGHQYPRKRTTDLPRGIQLLPHLGDARVRVVGDRPEVALLLDDVELRASMGAAGRRRAAQWSPIAHAPGAAFVAGFAMNRSGSRARTPAARG